MQKCIVNNSFFHDIIHSGINPYLTLHLAQVLMRIGDLRFIDLVKSIAGLASSTGQWPEAINPRTGLGCMGDGQHIWACAEWIIMIVNSFVMEQGEKFIIGAGVFPDWLAKENEITIGPVTTSRGVMRVKLYANTNNITVEWEGRWHAATPEIEVKLPGYEPVIVNKNKTSIKIERKVRI
jgi:hypothetical protein